MTEMPRPPGPKTITVSGKKNFERMKTAMNLWEQTGEHEMREIGGWQWAVPIMRQVELSSEERAAVDDPYNLPIPEPRVKVTILHIGDPDIATITRRR